MNGEAICPGLPPAGATIFPGAAASYVDVDSLVTRHTLTPSRNRTTAHRTLLPTRGLTYVTPHQLF